jgi:hypothetical protein
MATNKKNRPGVKATNNLRKSTRLSLEPLESRDLMSVNSLFFSGSTLVVHTDNSSTSADVRQVGSNYVIDDLSTHRSWTFAANKVAAVQFQGGAGNDRFVDNVRYLPVQCYGAGGNDYLEGYDAADYFDGGAGNDTLVGYGGNDIMFGGSGNDTLLGMAGDDQLVGGDGDDHLNGGAGKDKLWGGNGNDVLIAIDANTSDYVEGGAGRDTIWVDTNPRFMNTPFGNFRIGDVTDQVYGATAEDKVQNVAGFADGADRTLDGDRLAGPTLKAGQTRRQFNGPLFASDGPQPGDVVQGQLGDCYLLAGLGGIALDDPNAIRQNVVDFDDGTYGVRMGDKFYRVDNNLAVSSTSSTSPAFAQLGHQNSMWVAAVEKAFAEYRTGANSYASIEGGWSVEINRAWGTTNPGDRDIHSYSNATALANDLYTEWSNHRAVTIGFLSGDGSAPLVMSHMYTVMQVNRNSAGVVTSIVLRNPWGVDGAGNDSNPYDGLVTVTPDQLFRQNGRVNWGAV